MPWRKKLTSSGMQIATSEQRGHFGLSSSGGGIRPPAATRRRPLTAASAFERNSASKRHADPLAAAAEIKRAFRCSDSRYPRAPGPERRAGRARARRRRRQHAGACRAYSRPARPPRPRTSTRSSLAISPSRSEDKVTERAWMRSSSPIASASGSSPEAASTRR